MNSDDNDESRKVVLWLLILVVTAVLGLAIGVGLWKSRGAAPAKPVAAAPAAAATPTADGAGVKVENGVVKFYFASGKAELVAGANEALAQVVQATAAGKKAVISGFHDATGSPEQNAELARQRAFKVRDALAALGVPADRIELRKPEQMLGGSGSDPEARRVEVVAQ